MPQTTVTLPISGMSCANCAANIERSVKKLDGIEDEPDVGRRIADTRQMQAAFMDLEASSIFFASVETDEHLP